MAGQSCPDRQPLRQARILPVITIAREQDVLPLADALAAGG